MKGRGSLTEVGERKISVEDFEEDSERERESETETEKKTKKEREDRDIEADRGLKTAEREKG